MYATLRHMDHELEALGKAREHVGDVGTLVEMAKDHLREGRFEDASACLRLYRAARGVGQGGPRPAP